jgi:hypothetical protein
MVQAETEKLSNDFKTSGETCRREQCRALQGVDNI